MTTVLPAYRHGDQLLIWCAHEHRWHAHSGADYGHRVAHCQCSRSPLHSGGYRLFDGGPLTDDLRRRYRVRQRCECPRSRP